MIRPRPQPAAPPLKILFSRREECVDPWGDLRVAVTPVRTLRERTAPDFTVVAQFPLPDGGWEVYGQRLTERRKGDEPWLRIVAVSLVRAVTRDGVSFDDVRTVLTLPDGPWTDHCVLARNGDRGETLLLKLKVDNSGFAYTAFFSPDGRRWREHPGNPLFYDGDAMSLFWSPVLRRFVCVNKSLQPWPKRILDHGGPTAALGDDTLRDRRVLMIRTSPDGRRWEPDVSLGDVWNRNGRKSAIPSGYLLLPDEQDPPDLEFYSGNAFWWHDRAYMMVLNYAASPTQIGKHAPHLDNEWWTSADGLRWERPARAVNALADPFPEIPRLETPPMSAGGELRWLRGGRILGMPEDRISGIAARANAEFSTRPFLFPEGGLLCNAAVPSPERPFGREQAYLLAALCDERGRILPGFEADKCVVRGEDRRDIPLRWQNAPALPVGKRVRLRLFLRCATVYALTPAPL